MTKIVIISDTHSFHKNIKIPPADIIICAGDISFKGELDIIQDFANWMQKLPIKHKVSIFGNHELEIESGHKREPALKIMKDAGIHYLEDSGITIDGLKIWGSPIQPTFFNWEWNRERGSEIKRHWDLIPNDTDILVTHGPPYGILDLVDNTYGQRDPHQGCQDLLNRINDLDQLKLHAFGHLHLQGGNTTTVNNVIFANAAICDDRYKTNREPIIVEM